MCAAVSRNGMTRARCPDSSFLSSMLKSNPHFCVAVPSTWRQTRGTGRTRRQRSDGLRICESSRWRPRDGCSKRRVKLARRGRAVLQCPPSLLPQGDDHGVRSAICLPADRRFALDRGIPLVETIAGKGTVTHTHPAHAGPIGIVGSTSANALAAEADVIVAIGRRLQDFTTGSWTVFNHDARLISVNTAR